MPSERPPASGGRPTPNEYPVRTSKGAAGPEGFRFSSTPARAKLSGMLVGERLMELARWRWMPLVGLTSGALLFVLTATAVIPDKLAELPKVPGRHGRAMSAVENEGAEPREPVETESSQPANPQPRALAKADLPAPTHTLAAERRRGFSPVQRPDPPPEPVPQPERPSTTPAEAAAAAQARRGPASAILARQAAEQAVAPPPADAESAEGEPAPPPERGAEEAGEGEADEE